MNRNRRTTTEQTQLERALAAQRELEWSALERYSHAMGELTELSWSVDLRNPAAIG